MVQNAVLSVTFESDDVLELISEYYFKKELGIDIKNYLFLKKIYLDIMDNYLFDFIIKNTSDEKNIFTAANHIVFSTTINNLKVLIIDYLKFKNVLSKKENFNDLSIVIKYGDMLEIFV